MALASPSPLACSPTRILLAGRPAARPGLQWPVLVLGQTTGVYCLPSCAARPPLRKNVAFHASPEAAEARGLPCLQALQAARLAGRGRPQPAGGATPARCSTPPTPTCRPRSQPGRAARSACRAGALSKRFVAELGLTPRDWLVGAQARALPQGPAQRRVGDRRALWRGLRLAEPRLRNQRQGARHDARHLSPRAAQGRISTTPRVDSDYGRVLVAATRKGIAAVFLGDSDRTLERDLKQDFPAAEIERNDAALGAAGEAACWRGFTAASRRRSMRPTCRSTSSAPPSSGRSGRR